MKITIVGAGALGSHVILFCRNIDAELHIIDFDRVEKKNVMSQFHTGMGIGRNKTQALSQTMQGFFRKKLWANSNKLIEDNIEILLHNADLVVDCTDNAEARVLLQRHCKNRIPLLHGALAADGEFGACVWADHFKPDTEPSEGTATCEDGEQLPFITFVSSVIAMTIQEFVKDGTKRSTYIHPKRLLDLS